MDEEKVLKHKQPTIYSSICLSNAFIRRPVKEEKVGEKKTAKYQKNYNSKDETIIAMGSVYIPL